jgi:hypothetical protein
MIGFKQAVVVALLVTGLALDNIAQAALIDRGNGLIYDSTQNITWTADANIGGLMDFSTATAWAANLNYGGYNGWVLPTISQLITQFGVNIGYDYNNFDKSVTLSHNINYYLFSNIQYIPIISPSSYSGNPYYWSSTEYGLADMWIYAPYNATPYNTVKYDKIYSWAVRSGDVTAVPIPAAIWLFASGLGLLSFSRRSNKTSQLVSAAKLKAIKAG